MFPPLHFLNFRYVHVSSSCNDLRQDSFSVIGSTQKLTDVYPSYAAPINGINASNFIRVYCNITGRNNKGACTDRPTFAIVEASAVLANVLLINSTVGTKIVTVVTNLLSSLRTDSTVNPAFTFNSISVSVVPGDALRVIYHWKTNSCNGPALCTASLSFTCSNIVVAVSTVFTMPTIALKYLDAGNNIIDIVSSKLAPNNQQVFINMTSQPPNACPVPQSYPQLITLFPDFLTNPFKTLPDRELKAFPYFETSKPNLDSMSLYLSQNRLIAGSRFLITMNGNTFKAGSDNIANVDNNVLVMNIVYGNTTVLAVVNDNWNSRVSTVNVSLGSLFVNAFDSSCNVNADESSPVSLKLFYGAQVDCYSSQGINVSFFGYDASSRFVSGKFSALSIYLSKPQSGPYNFCICTGAAGGRLCTSKSFLINPGAPVDLVLSNVILGSSFSSSSAGLVGCVGPECGSNVFIEFSAAAFDINNNPVRFSNYSFTVLVEPLSASSQAVVLWDVSSGNAADIRDGNNNNNLLNPSSLFTMPSCTLSSSLCRLFISGVRGGKYTLKVSLASFGTSAVPGQVLWVYRREYSLSASPLPLANYSYPSNLFNLSGPLSVSSGQVSQVAPSLSINSFIIAPCPSDGQVAALALSNTSSDRSFGRCQCSPGYQQNKPASASDVGRGFGDTIGCSVCPANSYQQYAGGAVESCSKCPGSGNSSLPSSTLNAVGQTSVSACECAPGFLFVRIVDLPTTTNTISEVCQGSYNTTAPAECFCLPCDATKQTCTGGSKFYPRSADAVNNSGTGASSSQSSTSLSHFSFYNNTAYFEFLGNDSSLNLTASSFVPYYRLSSAAMQCKPRGDNLFSCLQQSAGGRLVYNGSQCEVGYTGFLCSKCAQYPFQQYARGAGQTCVPCDPNAQDSIRFLLFLFVCAILLVCSYFIGEARKPASVKNKFSVGTKTFLNHMQVLSFMSDLQSQWSSLIRSMFGIANMSNLGVNVGTLGCSVTLTFQSTLILYCLSPFILSSVPVFVYLCRCLLCYRHLWADTRRRRRLANNQQDHAALLNLDKGQDLDYIESRYNLEETELLHLSLTWKEHLRVFKETLLSQADITTQEAITLRFKLGQKLLFKQFWTDSVVVVMVVTFLIFSTISRQIFYTFSIRKCATLPFVRPALQHSSHVS